MGAYREQVFEVSAVVLEQRLADVEAHGIRVATDPDLELVVLPWRFVEGGRGWEGVGLRITVVDRSVEGLHGCGW